MAKKEYSVSRGRYVSEYVIVEAESPEEAIELAQHCDDEEWEKDANDDLFYYDYNAELEE